MDGITVIIMVKKQALKNLTIDTVMAAKQTQNKAKTTLIEIGITLTTKTVI